MFHSYFVLHFTALFLLCRVEEMVFVINKSKVTINAREYLLNKTNPESYAVIFPTPKKPENGIESSCISYCKK